MDAFPSILLLVFFFLFLLHPHSIPRPHLGLPKFFDHEQESVEVQEEEQD